MSLNDFAVLHQAQRMQAQSLEPITFYDILMLLRELEQEGDPGTEVLAALHQLATRAHVTDGGRDILRDYLRGLAVAYDRERARAARGISLKDDKKRARLPVDAWLSIAIDRAGGAGHRWVAKSADADVEIIRPGEADVGDAENQRATYYARARTRGTYRLLFENRSKDTSFKRTLNPPQPHVRRAVAALDSFEFWLVAELR